ncbi:MAG: EAL domain-containing protein, partial [Firmicutes bacterium]|nr:EAL domain-containing protein [Bacillota bacterium]
EMDDFGSGYSSLNMISTLPIDALKLDMNFIRNMHRKESKNNRIIELMIDIARYLEVPVVAEGVETQDQIDLLRSMGCHIVQGYYFSKPVSAEEFEGFIKELLG